MIHRRPRVLAVGLATAAVVLCVTAVAFAASKHGVTPIAPSAGSSVPSGRALVFRSRVRGPGAVWVFVCKSKRVDRHGVLCHDTTAGRARKRNGVFEFKQRFTPYDTPQFWLNKPGRYYWQAHRVYCNSHDCFQEGPVVPFRVR